MKRTWIILSASLLLCAAASERKPDPAEGWKLFKLYCIECHGQDGTGKPGIRRFMKLKRTQMDVTARHVQKKSDEELTDWLFEGQKKKPGFKGREILTRDRSADIIAYTRELTAGKVRLDPAPLLSRDDPPGKALYYKACAPCHGEHGTGIFKGEHIRMLVHDTGVVDFREKLAAMPKPPDKTSGMWLSFEGTLTDEEMDALNDYLRGLKERREAVAEEE